jgi:uncharacterized protein
MYGLMRIIFYAVLFWLILKAVNFIASLGQPKKRPPQQKHLSGTMVKDEICNTYIPKEEAIREVKGGQEHFFCSRECRSKFLDSRKKSA